MARAYLSFHLVCSLIDYRICSGLTKEKMFQIRLMRFYWKDIPVVPVVVVVGFGGRLKRLLGAVDVPIVDSCSNSKRRSTGKEIPVVPVVVLAGLGGGRLKRLLGVVDVPVVDSCSISKL